MKCVCVFNKQFGLKRACVFNKECVLMSLCVLNEECALMKCVCVCVCVCVCFNKKSVFETHSNYMYINLVSAHFEQGLMPCNISIINLSD
jgi:hypothetical protein